MKVTTENVATREVVLTIEPDMDRIERAKRKAASAISRWRPVPGFRPGKAPLGIVERVFGAEMVLNEAVHSVANDVFAEAVKEAAIEPFQAGELEVASQDPLQLSVKVALTPTVDLGDYRSVRIDPEPDVVVTDDMVNEELDALREEHAVFEPVDRPLLGGDQAVLAFKAVSDEGETVYEDEALEFTVDHREHPVLLVEALLGLSAGESTEKVIEFPDDYATSELRGRTVTVSATVNQVRQKSLPEVDDEFAKEASEYETAEELRDNTRKRILQELQDARDARERDAAIKALVERAAVEYPTVAVDRELDALIDNEKSRLRSMGFEWENYLRMVHRAEADMRQEARPQAEERMVRRLVLGEFARAEGLEVSPDEIDAEVNRLVEAYGGDKPEEMRRRLVESGVVFSIHNDLMTRRAVEAIVALVTGRPQAKETSGTEEAAEASDVEGTEAPEVKAEAADEGGAADQEPTPGDAQ